MIIELYHPEGIPYIERILSDPRMSSVVIVANPNQPGYEIISGKVEIAGKPNANIIKMYPEYAVQLFENIKSDKPAIIYTCHGALHHDIPFPKNLPDVNALSMYIWQNWPDDEVPLHEENEASSEDEKKLARIKEIRKFVATHYPYSCCAYNKPAYSYEDLVDEVVDDFMYGIVGLCGCGTPIDAIGAIYNYLYMMRIRGEDGKDSYEKADAYAKKWFNSNGIYGDPMLLFMAYMLDDCGLTEHGSSIGGAWLTEEGEMCLEALEMYMEINDDE